jgi:CRISPR-associated protein Csx17
MPEQVRTLHHLEGLRAQPLASYLTALAVLRLVHEQRDPTVSGAWCDGYFVLDTVLEREELLRFFLEEYQPTPLTSPWNGGSGYFPKDNKDGFNAILTTDQPRFAPYRQTLENVRALLTRMGIKEKPEGEDKTRLLRALRATLDDHSLKWLDAAVVLTDENGLAQPRYAPLLGTGGNDGRLEFSNNQMKRLADMFLSKKAKPQEHTELLEAALFGTLSQYLRGGAIGQFDPGSAGGVNLSTGFEGGSLINPWYYLFMVEGALVMAAAAVGRLGNSVARKAIARSSGFLCGNGLLATRRCKPCLAKDGPRSAVSRRETLWSFLWRLPVGGQRAACQASRGLASCSATARAFSPPRWATIQSSTGTTPGCSGRSRAGSPAIDTN